MTAPSLALPQESGRLTCLECLTDFWVSPGLLTLCPLEVPSLHSFIHSPLLSPHWTTHQILHGSRRHMVRLPQSRGTHVRRRRGQDAVGTQTAAPSPERRARNGLLGNDNIPVIGMRESSEWGRRPGRGASSCAAWEARNPTGYRWLSSRDHRGLSPRISTVKSMPGTEAATRAMGVQSSLHLQGPPGAVTRGGSRSGHCWWQGRYC